MIAACCRGEVGGYLLQGGACSASCCLLQIGQYTQGRHLKCSEVKECAQHTVQYHAVQYLAVQYRALHYREAVQFSTVQFSVVPRSVVLCSVVLCSVLPCIVVLQSLVPFRKGLQQTQQCTCKRVQCRKIQYSAVKCCIAQ